MAKKQRIKYKQLKENVDNLITYLTKVLQQVQQQQQIHLDLEAVLFLMLKKRYQLDPEFQNRVNVIQIRMDNS